MTRALAPTVTRGRAFAVFGAGVVVVLFREHLWRPTAESPRLARPLGAANVSRARAPPRCAWPAPRSPRAVVVQFDNRDPANASAADGSWWRASALINREYARRHNHGYVYYTLAAGAECLAHDGATALAPAWCKVLAMRRAMSEFASAELFLFLDSDSIVAPREFNVSLLRKAHRIARLTGWDRDAQPVLLSQDGPGPWCRLMYNAAPATFEEHTGGEAYRRHCLNAGAVMWWRHANASAFLRAWWRSATDAYDFAERARAYEGGPVGGGPFNIRFREMWPWEQERLHALLALFAALDVSVAHVVPHPQRLMMEWNPHARKNALPIAPWCFAHLPEARCFIEHYCANLAQKAELVQVAANWSYASGRAPCAGTVPEVVSTPLVTEGEVRTATAQS